MNIDKILEYQKKDFELIKLQRQLENDEDKKIYTQMIASAKDSQNKSAVLEKEAGELISDFEQLKKIYEDNVKSAGKVSTKNLDNSKVEELDNVVELSSNILSNLNVLEKKILALAEKVNSILSDFEQTKKKYNQAREKHKVHKQKYEDKVKELEPQMQSIEKELVALEKQLDKEMFAKYKQRRQDKIYPVFVPNMDKSCGGCRMELPSASLEKLKEKGFLECEHCRRIIYAK